MSKIDALETKDMMPQKFPRRSRGTVVNSNDSIKCPSWVHGFNPRMDRPPQQGLTIRLRGNELSLESLISQAGHILEGKMPV